MTLKYGEPIHQMVARALLSGGITIKGELPRRASFHFVGPHGYVQEGIAILWGEDARAEEIARLCETVQVDFNEHQAALSKARQYARESLSVAPLFKSLVDLGNPPAPSKT